MQNREYQIYQNSATHTIMGMDMDQTNPQLVPYSRKNSIVTSSTNWALQRYLIPNTPSINLPKFHNLLKNFPNGGTQRKCNESRPMLVGYSWCKWKPHNRLVRTQDVSGSVSLRLCYHICILNARSACHRMLLWVECFWEKARTRHLSPLDSTKGPTSMRCPEFISRWRRTWCWSWSNKRRWWIGGRQRRFMSWRATTAPTSPPRLSSSTCSSKRHLPSRFRDLCLGNYQVLHFTLCDSAFWLFATWL